jgi:anti-sigma factor RsiW
MSCRRVSRELLERFRFGEELGPSSEPHLAHLQSCSACRTEVGLDRALVVQLRNALRARVAGAAPSPRSWEVVRERAMAADGSPTRRADLWRSLRLAPAAAAMSLMIFAVAITQESDAQNLIPEPDWPRLERIDSAQPDWEMPWWLAAREGPPPAPQARGPLDKIADEVSGASRNGPFSEFVE